MNKTKKILLIIMGSIVAFAVITIVFISPIAKYLVEKYDKKYVGRQITIDWAYINPFTGSIHLKNFKAYEFNSDSVFLSVNDISTSIAIGKLLSKNYEINELILDQPKGIIKQTNKMFNFDDLIEKFSSSDTTVSVSTEKVKFSILNIKINDGEFYFRESQIPINYFIKKVNFESSGKQWNSDTLMVKFSFLPGIGSGTVKGDFTLNLQSLDYRIATNINQLDLQIIEQYLKDLTNYGRFRAKLDASIKAKGNFKDSENITAQGSLAINDFHFGKNLKEDYASFNKFSVSFDEISPKKRQYLFDSVLLSRPYFKYEQYDYLDNLQTTFGKEMSTMKAAKSDNTKFNLVIEIANYIKILSRNFFRSNYKINRLAIENGDIKFNDFAISEKFAINLYPLNIRADSIDKSRKRVKVFLKSGIKPYGNVSIALSINPKDSSDFNIQYNLQKMSAPMFNPYTISFSSFPLDRGTIEINGKWNVRNGKIQSDNHLLVIDPRISKRLRNKDRKWLPLPLIMAFVRERGNVIDYQIPITGDLNNPKFRLKDVILDILKNIFVKPPTTPYSIKIKNVETEIEKTLTLKWELRQSSLIPSQEKFIDKIVDFLEKNQGAFITVYPQQYQIKEKEYLLFFEAKKKYFLTINNKKPQSLDETDLEKIDKMSVKDSAFIRYLNKRINNPMIFTIQEKCNMLINDATIDAKFKELNKERENTFLSYFKEKGLEKRVKIYAGKNTIPYNGFSFYKIDYKGELPNFLLKAYQEIEKLNDEAPRRKFKKERRENTLRTLFRIN